MQIAGLTGTILETDATFKALRATIRPPEVLSENAVSVASGALTTIAAATATAGHIVAFRWADATRFCMVRFVELTWITTTGFTAAQPVGFDMILARGYTASHTGGAAVSFALANTQQMRTNMTDSLFSSAGEIRFSNGATALTAGTHTLDTNSLSQIRTWVPAATAGAHLAQAAIFKAYDGGYPIVLAQNEGFIIRNSVLMGAAGVGTLIANIGWQEAAAY